VPSPQQALEQRVADRWDALVARNFELAYTYETPSFRQVYDLAQFKARFGERVKWAGASVRAVNDLGNGVAEVTVRLRYEAVVPIPGMDVQRHEAVLKEKWLQEGGAWFHVTE